MNSLERLRAKMAEKGITAALLTEPTNIRWISGFTGSSSVCVITADKAVFITDSRYTIQANDEVKELEVRWFQSPKNQEEMIAEAFSDLGVTEVWFESSLTYGGYDAKVKKHTAQKWNVMPDLVAELRMIKTADEITKIKTACKLADACMEHVSRLLQVGVREYDICLDLEFFLKRNGAVPAFDPIVVSGPNSAKPHGKPGERKLERGDFVTIDLGAKLNGYNSDMTRTFVIGEASDRHAEIYNQVLKAEVECCKLLKPGTNGVAVDAVAREILDEKGLAQYFGHGLGHGLGLSVHDPGGLSPRSTNAIEVGQVWTVEPGVYIDGFGGVRIEDDVLVTDGEPEILTFFPKELMVLG